MSLAASGLFNLASQKLSLSQRERERTSNRINQIIDDKIQRDFIKAQRETAKREQRQGATIAAVGALAGAGIGGLVAGGGATIAGAGFAKGASLSGGFSALGASAGASIGGTIGSAIGGGSPVAGSAISQALQIGPAFQLQQTRVGLEEARLRQRQSELVRLQAMRAFESELVGPDDFR